MGWGIAAVVVLVALNGFFVATEFALVAVRRSRLEQLVAEGKGSAATALHLTQHLDYYIAGCQFGITMASLALGWVGEPALSHLIEAAVEPVVGGLSEATGHAVAVAVAFAIITSLHIVAGELAPKGVALQRTEATVLWVARPMRAFSAIFKWPIRFLNAIGNAVLRLFGLSPASETDESHTPEEIRYLLAGMQKVGTVEASEARIAARAVEFADRTAASLMTPRPDVRAIPVESSIDEVVQRFLDSGHTRMPVYRSTLDDVVGFIHAHDVLAVAVGDQTKYDITTLVRNALVVPESAAADSVLAKLQEKRMQLAVVIDEYGGTSGIVTLEDILEALVGRIEEEYGLSNERQQSPLSQLQADGSYLVDGRARLDEIDEILGSAFEESTEERIDTIAGIVITELGRVPAAGDVVETAGWRLVVEEMDGPRVVVMRLRHLAADSSVSE